MKTKLLVLSVALATGVVLADAPQGKNTPRVSREERMRQLGGVLEVPNSGKGAVAIANKQARVPVAEIEKALDFLRRDVKSSFVIGGADVKGEVLIEIVDDKTGSSALVVMPEEHRAIVNVAKLDAGLATDAAKTKFYLPRVRKEVLRAYAYAVGCAGTQFPDNILRSKGVADLDHYGEFLPMDCLSASVKMLAGIGVTPKMFTHYRRACIDGWAPAPTNEVQKAIWDKVHALPTNPLPLVKPTK